MTDRESLEAASQSGVAAPIQNPWPTHRKYMGQVSWWGHQIPTNPRVTHPPNVELKTHDSPVCRLASRGQPATSRLSRETQPSNKAVGSLLRE